jgi:hypothetical protein
MCAEKPAGVRDGTEVFALGGFTETLGGIQAGILKVRVRAPDCDTNPAVRLRSDARSANDRSWHETDFQRCPQFGR